MTIRTEPTAVADQYAFIIPLTHPFHQRHPDAIKLPACFGLDTKFSSAAIKDGRWVWFGITKSPKTLAKVIDMATEYFQLTREFDTVKLKSEAMHRELMIAEDKIKKGPPAVKVPVMTSDTYLEQPVEKVRTIEHDGSEEASQAFTTLLYQSDAALDALGADTGVTQIGMKFSVYLMTANGIERVDVTPPEVKTDG